jgi:HAMP domain-containing protein
MLGATMNAILAGGTSFANIDPPAGLEVRGVAPIDLAASSAYGDPATLIVLSGFFVLVVLIGWLQHTISRRLNPYSTVSEDARETNDVLPPMVATFVGCTAVAAWFEPAFRPALAFLGVPFAIAFGFWVWRLRAKRRMAERMRAVDLGKLRVELPPEAAEIFPEREVSYRAAPVSAIEDESQGAEPPARERSATDRQ